MYIVFQIIYLTDANAFINWNFNKEQKKKKYNRVIDATNARIIYDAVKNANKYSFSLLSAAFFYANVVILNNKKIVIAILKFSVGSYSNMHLLIVCRIFHIHQNEIDTKPNCYAHRKIKFIWKYFK